MENKTILPDNDLTERRSRRRISSILKAPRSPLRDLGIGNELYQEPTIEKRRKSSRRVSFAETIRVFTPELKPVGSGDADSGGVGTARPFCNENERTDGKCPITGMDRLLHGPLQAPAHQAEWNNTNCNKEQTIYFSSDNMDMTASNTVAIDGLIEEKPRKIDTSLFLASLRAPMSEDSSHFDSKFLAAGEKLWEFQPSATSSTQSKIKFGDFLACLGNERTTSSNIGVDKENIFPFVSKENLFSTKTTLPFFNTNENTGNFTCVFKDQEDGLDLTKCHTTNITSFLPTVNHQLTNLSSGNPSTSYSSTRNKLEFSLFQGASVEPPRSVSIEQTLLCEDDMDMTFSHTTRIQGVLKENAPSNQTNTYVACNNQKTIIFTDENEMELTENDSVFFNNTFKKDGQSVKRDSNVFFCNQDTVGPEDMNMTRSHTVAIDGPAICEIFSKDGTGDTVQSGKRQRSFGLLLPFQMASSSSKSCVNGQQVLAQLNPLSLKSGDIGQNKTIIGNTVAETKCGKEKVTFRNQCSISKENDPLPFTEKTILFACEQDDMEMTKSHTVAIDRNAHDITSNACFPNPNLNPIKCHLLSRSSSGFNKTVFFSRDSDDMDLTQSHTVLIDQKSLVRNNLSNGTQNCVLNATDQTKRAQKDMEITAAENDCLRIRSALTAAENKTVVVTGEQQNMDITQLHAVSIDGDAWCKEFKLNTGNDKDKEHDCVSTKEINTVLGSNRDSKNVSMQASVDDQMTSLSNPCLGFNGSCADPADVLSGKLGDHVYRTIQDNTMVFPSDQDDMELTKSHTIAIDSKIMSLSDSTHKLKPILKDKKSNGGSRLSTIHNRTVFFSTVGDDMELTQSHTTCINQNHVTIAKEKLFSNAVNQTRHVLDDMEMTMVETAGLQIDPTMNESNNNKTVVFTSDQQDMDITQSHTVAIDGDALSKTLQSDTCLDINKRENYILAVPRCLPDKDFVLESKNDCGSVGTMDLVKEYTLVSSSKSELSFSGSHINITNMSCQQSAGPLKGNAGVFISKQDDMDMTCGNTVAIKRILLPGDSTNKAITHAPCPDETVVLEDDMEYTKSHTAVIDGINKHELQSQSGILKTMAISADDMDITKSNTVFINSVVTDERPKDDQQNKYKNTFMKLTGPSDLIPDDLKITVYSKRLIPDEAKAVEKVSTMSAFSKDKIFNSLDQEDMDLTRTNTIAIENKVLGEVEKLQTTHLSKTQICFADMDITKSNTVFIDHIPARIDVVRSTDNLASHKPIVLHGGTEPLAGQTELKDIISEEVTNNARVQINENRLLCEPSKNRLLMKKNTSGDEENLVELPNKHFVNDLPCEQIELDLSSQSYVFTGTSKREIIPSHQKSFCIFDETVQVCNMSETTANIDLVIGNNDEHPSKGLFNQTCNQGEMEITKCHTTAIESKMGATPSNCPVESHAPVHKATSLFSKDMPVNFTVNTDAELLKSDTFTRNKGPHQTHMYECVLPCEQGTMESTKAPIAVAKVNSEENCCENSNESNRENIQVVKFVEMSNLPSATSQNGENNLNPPINTTEKKGSKQNNFTELLPSETPVSSEGMEFPQFDSMVADGLFEQGKKTTFAAIEKTYFLSDPSPFLITSHTAFIGQESKDIDQGTCSDEIKRPSSTVSLASDNCVGIVSDHKNANTKMDMALDDKYIKLDGNALPDRSAPSISTETIPLHTQIAGDHKPINAFTQICDLSFSSETGANSASQKQEMVPGNLCSEQSEVCENYPGAVKDYQVTKNHRLSKRVSFCFSEKDRVGESVVEPNTEITLQNRKKMINAPNNQSNSSQHNPGKINEQTGNISVKFDFTDKVLIGSSPKSNKYLNCATAESIAFSSEKHESDQVANNVQEAVSLFEPSQKDKRRRSIADIQLKIRSLTDKSKNKPSNHTAPVFCFELSTLPQTLNPTSGGCIPEQTLLNEQVSIKDIQAENKPIGKGSGPIKETGLQNRLSVSMLQPKLPSKRHSSTCNLQELAPSISKPPTQTSRTSMSLKAFMDGDTGHCIDEEMLPACLDDQDGNSLFQYEVPEGAWEELCEKEALHENLNDCLSKDSVNGHKRARDPEDDRKLHREKRVRRDDDTQNTQTSVGFKSQEECSRNDFSSHTSKTMEQTYCSSSSHDSRGEGMSVELNSQQYSQMDSQLPCDKGYGQKFQDGTITVKEFFMLLGIRALIQKPRCSELPVNRGNDETLSATDLMLDLFIYQPKLQVYEEECHTLYQTTEELKLYTDMQDKPLTEVSSLLWEEMRMCSENELMLFGTTLKNRKSMYAKKSKILAHEAKVSIYSKLLHKAQVQVVELQSSITETAKLIEEVDDCISSLQIETARLEQGFKNNSTNIPGGNAMQFELENMISLEQIAIREKSHLENQKEKVLTHLGCLQDEARGLDKRLQEPCFAEWDMVNWTDTKATFVFLHDSLELTVLFGEEIDGEKCNRLCRRISRIILMSQLNEEAAPPSSLLVHRLIIQFIQKKGYLHDTCKMQSNVPQLLFDVSLAVSRCKLLGEEVEYLMKWGAKYNIVRTDVKSNEVKLLFSSTAAFAKFELSIQISEMYPTDPLSFIVLNRIGSMDYSRVAAAISKVPVGLWLLKRAVKSIHENLLV
ncbi:outer kinetochore KNL1 complex subunit KNL1 isoform X2 [Lithobates pipiens]